MSESHDLHLDTRSRLMEAALLVIAEKGYDGAGIREISQRAGVNSALVQYHFGGKEGLYVAAMTWISDMLESIRPPWPKVPDPREPDATRKALEALRRHLDILLDEFLTGQCCQPKLSLSAEVWRAAHRLWNRELEEPRPAMAELMLKTIRPFQEHLHACLRVLRPELTPDQLHLMGLSIHGQLLFLHKHLDLIRLLRGRAYGPEDMELLSEHFSSFTFRGLGLMNSQGELTC